jgi:DNA-binding GntR family transcriptional regulator
LDSCILDRHVTHPAPDRVVLTGLADEIAYRIQAAILEGEYPAGTRLQQEDLCRRFGVSRTPVREALRKLQAQHLVELVPNKGATVRSLSRRELGEVYALRAELEGFAAELAAARIGAAELAALDDAHAAMERVIATIERGSADAAGINAAVTEANERFHGVIHEAAGNRRLAETLAELQRAFPKDYVWRAITSADEARELNLAEHVAIRDALARGDGAAARRAMSDHVAHAGAVLLAHLDERGFWP